VTPIYREQCAISGFYFQKFVALDRAYGLAAKIGIILENFSLGGAEFVPGA